MNDPYKEAAAVMFGVSIENVTTSQRDQAKRRAFGSLYAFRKLPNNESEQDRIIRQLADRRFLLLKGPEADFTVVDPRESE